MKPEPMNAPGNKYRTLIVGAVLSLSLVFWLQGLLSSQIHDPRVHIPKRKAAALLRDGGSDHAAEAQLARAYWLRYEDIRTDPFFGESGLLGIYGAGEHYQQHGRLEGRIYGLIAEGEDPERERLLAEAYWRRYPAVASSPIWGRSGALGLLGPRDHYRYIGRHRKMIWGVAEQDPGSGPEAISNQPN